ncbi:DUF2716 domain-containing protein [Streptomyces erythrochromogenes]|uniref:DUF2716 domain-containing protein n=1 Tax=Streptomyces erythrochromogenes TaxID=285574 RepID=UPI00331D3609
MDIGGVRALHDAQLRGRVPRLPPAGAVIEHDGPFVRTHYGTHGTVEHGPLPRPPGAATVRRQLDAFAARNEPAEWKVHGSDAPGLAEELTAAGFEAGAERSLLVAECDALEEGTAAREDVRALVLDGSAGSVRVRELAATTGPHALPLGEFEADAHRLYQRFGAAALSHRGRTAGAGWAGRPADTDFVVVGGLTGPHPELVRHLARLREKAYLMDRAARYCLVEAHGELRTALVAAGFEELTTVRPHRWAPTGTPATTRPVRETIGALDDGPLWDRLEREFGFRPSTSRFPGFEAPAPSVTWSLDAVDRGGDEPLDELRRITERALRSLAAPGQQLFWLDWQHIGYAFDPHRVGGPGRPRWPGSVYPDGDYYLFLHPDLEFGTFGHPWEGTLTVFGTPLLAAVEARFTALLGEPLRRRE